MQIIYVELLYIFQECQYNKSWALEEVVDIFLNWRGVSRLTSVYAKLG